MTTQPDIGSASASAEANRRPQEAAQSFPHPSDSARSVQWNGSSFDVDGKPVRVLAYTVAPSGWTDALTQLHEDTGGSDHFIDVASREHALDEVGRVAVPPSSLILEIGCSSGFLLRSLIARFPGHPVVGADYTYGTLQSLGARLLGVPLLQFDLTRCPLPDAWADVIILLNVLEHIGDDEKAMAELFRIVRPGGAVIVEVPSGGGLFDVYDRVLMHHRRYDMSLLVERMRKTGFVVEKQSHLGFFLYPAFYVTKRLNQIRYRADSNIDEEAIVANMIAATRKTSLVFGWLMAIERALRRIVYLPFGIRCLVTCRKPAGS
jgi:SAM-dependent methyltransferase